MLQVLGTWLLTSITFLITSYVVPGFNVSGLGAALWASAIVGLLNMFLRPILLLLTLPVNILTLGLFTFVVNAIVLKIAASMLSGFEITGWLSAILGAVILAIVQAIAYGLFGAN
jgi:putative membrane protein